MEKLQQNKMGVAPVTGLLLSMAFPAMLSMLIQALYNIVDSIYVSRIGQEALSAISIAFPLQMLMISISVGTGVGVNSLVARRLGEGKRSEANEAAGHGIVLALISWGVVALIGIFGVGPFFRMTTDNPVIIEMGVAYTQMVMILSFGAFIQMCIEKILQATGNMIFPMCSQLLGCVINIIFDPILIFGYLGFPKLGIKGAAIATVFGQICAMVFCIIIMLTKTHEVHVSLKKFKFKGETVKNIYIVALPAIIMQAIGSVLVTFLNMILIKFTESAVNVLGIYYKLQSFIYMPVFGLTQGAMPIMGYNYGAGNKKRLQSALKVGTVLAAAIMLVGTIVFHLIPGFLLSWFNADESTMQIGITAMKTISLCFIPSAFGILFSTLFQALGMGTKSLILSLVRQLVCILPAAYLLSKISVSAVWYAFPIAECLALVLGVVMYIGCYKKVISKLSPVEAAQ